MSRIITGSLRLNPKRVLITGITGFIGSYLAQRYQEAGSCVYGISQYTSPLYTKLIIGDIADQNFIHDTLNRYSFDLIINCAGYSGPIRCNENQQQAYATNFLGLKNIVDEVVKRSYETKIIQLGSRLEYGKSSYLPVDENHPTHPLDYYGTTKLLASRYLVEQARMHNLDAVVLRIANVYGKSPSPTHFNYNIINHYISLAQNHKPITVYGTGSQLRDYLYINDLIECIFQLSQKSYRGGILFNIGLGKGISILDMASFICRLTQSPIKHISWPSDRKSVETGDYYSDIRLVQRSVSWKPIIHPDIGIMSILGH